MQNKSSDISTNGLSEIMGLLRAEQHVGNPQNMNFQKLWDSRAQNKTSELSTNVRSRIMGLLWVEQNVGHLQKTALSRILGLLCADQDVGNLNKCTSKNYGTPVRKTKRHKSQKMHFQEFWDSCMLNKASEISKNALLGCAEQNVGNLKNCTFRNSGTPVRRTKRRKSQKCTVMFFGPQLAEQNVRNLKQCQLCIGSEQSTCPSSQRSTCPASQQGRCLGSQQCTCLTFQH